MNDNIPTESYKGVRDFYPEDQSVQNYIFDVWKKVSRSFGYEEYSASLLEPAELYKVKTNEEIINEQTYTFRDRGDREVTLRPEMTPTVARMVASKKRELTFPLRWFSVTNIFRYERPQRGRLREHWQLNADIFGVDSIEAEIEIISLASNLLKTFGLENKDFEIRISSRKIINAVLRDLLEFDEITAKKSARLLDRKSKVEKAEFEKEAELIADDKTELFLKIVYAKDLKEFEKIVGRISGEALDEIKKLLNRLEDLGIDNVRFDQSVMRGFDYYTGIVFEIFDNNPKNNRSLFGGGRYDDLLGLFGNEKISAVGFGMGDVTIKDALEVRNLLPESPITADIALCPMDESALPYAEDLAQKLRAEGSRVMIDFSSKKIGDKIKNADKRKIPFALVIGEEEIKSKKLKIKRLKTGEEKEVSEENLIESLRPME